MNTDDRTEKLKTIRDEVINLTESPLYEYRQENNYLPVIGEGAHDADIMFIGEAPGKNEAQTGRPFCGAAGDILNEMLNHIDLDRDTVYITNIIKDRPPENRDPTTEEVEIYSPFLDRQIEIIDPDIIVTLGRHAMEYILEKLGVSGQMKKISDAHGSTYTVDGLFGAMTVIPLYHPAVATYNPNEKETLLEDMAVIKSELDKS